MALAACFQDNKQACLPQVSSRRTPARLPWLQDINTLAIPWVNSMRSAVLVNKTTMKQGSLISAEDLTRMEELVRLPPPGDRWASCWGAARA